MIRLENIPDKPRKEDFLVSDLNVNIAQVNHKEALAKHKKYKEKNENSSYILGFISICIITGIIINNINPNLSGFGLIFCSIVFGVIGMFPIGFVFSNIFQKVGEEVEPDRKPKTDTLKRADAYVVALEAYEKRIKSISVKYPEIELAEYNETKYNELLRNKTISIVEHMLRQVRMRSLSCTSLHLSRVFNNLDIIGFENKKLINDYHHIYEAEKGDDKYAITFCDPIYDHSCNIFCEVMQKHNLTKGVIVTPNIRIKDEGITKILNAHNVELIALKNFERAALKILDNEELPYTPAVEIPFENIHKVSARYDGYSTRIIVIRIVTEVFEKRSEIFERIKNAPKSTGMYGIFPIFKNRMNPFWGAVYFQWQDEFDYYREWFSHAINDYRKDTSKIVLSNSGTWDPHKRFSYQFWSNYEHDMNF